MNVDHCVPQEGGYWRLIAEFVPMQLKGHAVHVSPSGVDTAESAYKFDLEATQCLNYRMEADANGVFHPVPPGSFEDTMEAFEAYLERRGGSFAE